jgi:hypothetical protein
MSHEEVGNRRLAEKARRLYWDSDRSVNSIADDLGLSKGRLYDLIDSLPAGMECPACGTELVYENRTARDRNLPTCPLCGPEEDAEEQESAASGGLAYLSSTGDAARVLGGLLVGAAGAILLVRYLRR